MTEWIPLLVVVGAFLVGCWAHAGRPRRRELIERNPIQNDSGGESF